MLDNSQFTSLLQQSLSEDQMRAVFRGLIADAASLDKTLRLPARAELFNRLYGKPAAGPVDTSDAQRSAARQLSDQELLARFQEKIAPKP